MPPVSETPKTPVATGSFWRGVRTCGRPFVLILCVLAIVMTGAMGGADDAWAKSKKKSKSKSKAVARPYNPTNAYYVIEAESGMVLDQFNADRTLYPASLTKLMTLLMVFDTLESRRITLQSRIRFSSHAASMPPSRLGVEAGDSISVDQAIRALVTKSANDVAAAVAENLGGSESRFAYMMTLKAREIGLTKTRFVNGSGLHNTGQLTSAHDMALLGQYIWKRYPKYYGYFALKEFYYGGKMHQNHNHLMKTYRGMDGMKTGYVTASGFNLVASAKRDGVRLIGVVIGGKTATVRNKQMEELLDKGFETVKHYRAQGRVLQRQTPQGRAPSAQKIPPAQNLSGGSYYVPPPVLSAPPPVAAEAQRGGMRTLTLNPPSTAPVAAPVPVPERKTEQKPEQVAAPAEIPQQNAPLGLANESTGWSVQIGAYQDRISTDQAIYKAVESLPATLRHVNPVVIPLRTGEAKWIFRARLSGYTKTQAYNACRVLQNCLVISPTAN